MIVLREGRVAIDSILADAWVLLRVRDAESVSPPQEERDDHVTIT